jgi:chorismate synthase
MGIHSFKGAEIGDGWSAARLPGSQVHDAVFLEDGKIVRHTNRAGGLEGGMTNGAELVIRGAVKPIATLMRPLPTVDVVTKQATDASRERSDTTAVPAASIVMLAMTALVLVNAVLEKFGEDTMREITERVSAHRAYVDSY